MALLNRVERYLRKSGTPPTRFGRDATHDPRFVLDLRQGREPRKALSHRVTTFIEARETELGR
jgi:hypothetical protein